MKSASRFLSIVTLALAAGMVSACVHTETFSEYPGQSEIETRQITATHQLNHCSPMMPSQIGVVINFNSGSDKLTPAAQAEVAKVAAILSSPAFIGSHVTVEGYTDAAGKASKNVRLSYHRALAVVHALIKDGVPAGLLSAQGFGAANPVATNSTAAGRAENRRVSFSVVGAR